MQLNKECLEELNSITYENSNYGQVWSSRSCHVSRTNRVALATNRCLFVLNMSLEWPSKLKTSCAQKYLNRLSSSAAEPTGSNRMHIEQWIQDLRDVRNASFFANVITFAPRSTRLVDVYKRLLFADRIAECQVDGSSGISSSKRKSFYQQMLEKMRNANNNYNSLIDNNREQFSVHKSLSEQNLMFDPVYFEYVSHLVLQQHIQGSKNAELLDGYKLCMWNSRADRHLLASLTRSNQLIIFDCTLLSVSNQQNTPPSHPDESKTYTHVFDTTTGSACFDLTEFWLAEYKESLIPSVASGSSSLEENMTYLDLVVPVCFVWAHNPIRFLHNDVNFVVDLLFVAFKSNEIACFLVYDHLKVKTLTTINLSKHDRQREENDEEVNENLVKSGRFLITSLHFTHDEKSQGLLSIGLSDGRSFITKLAITKDRILETLNDPKYTLVENSSSINELELLPQIESVIKFELTPIGNSSSYLGVILVESCVKIALLDILDDNEAKIRIKHKLTHRLEYSPQDDDNSLIQGHFRVIDFKLIPESTKKPSYDLILTFRNSLIDTIKLSIVGSKIELSKVSSSSSDLRLSDCKCKSDLFKSTRQVFLSTNRCLMFQIVDFSKSILVQKQPPQFQVNVFHVKNNQSLSIFSDYYSTNPERTVAEQSDYLWYFKQMLYLNHDKLMSMIYQEFYNKLKEIKLESGEAKNADKDRYLSELKRMRILTSFFAEYFETVSSFEAYNLQQLSLSVGEAETSDEDDEDDEESMSSEEEASKAAKRRRRQRQTTKTIPIPVPISQPIDQSNDNVVKSPDYYKSMHREITLLIFRYHCLRVIQIADSIGFDRLTSRERILAAFMKDFALKKNFISEKKKNKSEVTASQNELKCDICSRKFNFASSLELNRVECESGHLMARCEKTLFPLDNFKFKKCFSCNSLWNYLKPQDFPHFDFLVSSVDYCLFCN